MTRVLVLERRKDFSRQQSMGAQLVDAVRVMTNPTLVPQNHHDQLSDEKRISYFDNPMNKTRKARKKENEDKDSGTQDPKPRKSSMSQR